MRTRDGGIERHWSTKTTEQLLQKGLTVEDIGLFFMLANDPLTRLSGVVLGSEMLRSMTGWARKKWITCLKRLEKAGLIDLRWLSMGIIWIPNLTRYQVKNPNQWRAAILSLEGLPIDLRQAWYMHYKETIPETLSETLSEILPETLSETIPETTRILEDSRILEDYTSEEKARKKSFVAPPRPHVSRLTEKKEKEAKPKRRSSANEDERRLGDTIGLCRSKYHEATGLTLMITNAGARFIRNIAIEFLAELRNEQSVLHAPADKLDEWFMAGMAKFWELYWSDENNRRWGITKHTIASFRQWLLDKAKIKRDMGGSNGK